MELRSFRRTHSPDSEIDSSNRSFLKVPSRSLDYEGHVTRFCVFSYPIEKELHLNSSKAAVAV